MYVVFVCVWCGLMTDTTESDGPGPRANVRLYPPAVTALERLTTNTGMNRTDAVNKALVTYDDLLAEQGAGATYYVRDPKDPRELIRIRFS
jgi:hypothetical protein